MFTYHLKVLLQLIDCSNNKLSSLPAEIGNLINLKALDLTGNKLISLPAEIGNLINLQILNLFNGAGTPHQLYIL